VWHGICPGRHNPDTDQYASAWPVTREARVKTPSPVVTANCDGHRGYGLDTMYSAPAGSVEDVGGGTNAQNGAADYTRFTAATRTVAAGRDGPEGVGGADGMDAS
jgi:hypothetical protein